MTSERGSLTGNTLHHTSITQKGICVVVDDFESRLIELGGGMMLSNSKTNSVGEALAKGARGNFNAFGVVRLRMARSDAIY
jgi:hypothetical protein